MTDEPTTSAATAPVCPWCSAVLPPEGAARCPSCGAALTNEVDESLPGLTAIDASAIVRSRQTAIRPRSRLLSWLSGDDGEDVFTKAEGNALEPPELAVKREMFRMELEAEVANLQAENEAILAEAAAEGRVVELPPELADAAEALVPVGMAGAISTSEEGATAEIATAPESEAPVAEAVAAPAGPDATAPAPGAGPGAAADAPAEAPAPAPRTSTRKRR
jgi:hypothetical protein